MKIHTLLQRRDAVGGAVLRVGLLDEEAECAEEGGQGGETHLEFHGSCPRHRATRGPGGSLRLVFLVGNF
jgi:hypothetical protein